MPLSQAPGCSLTERGLGRAWLGKKAPRLVWAPPGSPAEQPSGDSLYDLSGGPAPINPSAAEEAKSSQPWTTGGKTHPCQGSLLHNSPQLKTTQTPTRRRRENKRWCFYTTAHDLATTRTNS